jgi:periplasmic protein TonB
MSEDQRSRRIAEELQRAERWVRQDPRDRRWLMHGFVIALALHAVVLIARVPIERDPVRIEPPPEEAMQVQFLQPPPPPPPPPPPEKPPEPKPQVERIPQPILEPEPEPIPEPPPPPPPPDIPVSPQLPPTLVPPGPPPQGPPAPPQPVRVSPGEAPGLIKRVEPDYPRVAQATRVEGLVVLDAIIGTDGSVREVTVLRSAHPLLDQAAIEAVSQWRYSPPPADVILTVTVNFTLR